VRRVLLATLLSSLTLTATAATGKPATDATAPTTAPVSNAVTEPHLVYKPEIHIPESDLPLSMVTPDKVILALKLDETGRPTRIDLVKAINQTVDARVIAGVRQFRWTPAVVNNHTVPSDLTLIVEVAR
jgi:hypothetical protein